ncbi:ankyrin repeat domain-containing protein [Agarilytica rhodophyticola]|uniref:ankyrin repeat domain-containing protein n=1 Tax=Agarilytica rhodophyticola TaxID=1737490 RepID=UPI000B3435ED|nr:ankyrin repeat domain-containing protein [Agarilytica rhodophyticola]
MLNAAASSQSASHLNTPLEKPKSTKLDSSIIKGCNISDVFFPIAKKSLLAHAEKEIARLDKLDGSAMQQRFPIFNTDWSSLYKSLHKKAPNNEIEKQQLTSHINQLLDVFSKGSPEITLPKELQYIYGNEGKLRKKLESQVESDAILMLIKNISSFATLLSRESKEEQAKYLTIWPGDPMGDCVPALNKDLYELLGQMTSNRDIINDSVSEYISSSIQAHKLTRGVYSGIHTHIPVALENSTYLPDTLAKAKDSFAKTPMKSFPAHSIYQVVSGLQQGTANKLKVIAESELTSVSRILEKFIGDGKRNINEYEDLEKSAYLDGKPKEQLEKTSVFKALIKDAKESGKDFDIRKYVYNKLCSFNDEDDLIGADLSALARDYKEIIEKQYIRSDIKKTKEDQAKYKEIFNIAFANPNKVASEISNDLREGQPTEILAEKASAVVDFLHSLSNEFRGGSIILLGNILQQLGEKSGIVKNNENSEYREIIKGLDQLESLLLQDDKLASEKIKNIEDSLGKLVNLERSIAKDGVNLRTEKPALDHTAKTQEKVFRALLENNAPLTALAGLESLEGKRIEIDPSNLLFHPQKDVIMARYGNRLALDVSKTNKFADSCAVMDDVAMFKAFLPNIQDPKSLGFEELNGATPAHTAIENNSLKMLEHLSNQGCANLDSEHIEYGDVVISHAISPILKATYEDNLAAMEVLLNSEQVEYPIAPKLNPLYLAAHFGNFDMVKQIANSEKVDKKEGITDYLIGITENSDISDNHVKVVKTLLDSPNIRKIPMAVTDNPGFSAPINFNLFHLLAGKKSKAHIEIFKDLLASPKVIGNINQQYYAESHQESFSPIKLAVRANNVVMVKELLAAKDLKVSPDQYMELFHLAKKSSNKELTKLLLNHYDAMTAEDREQMLRNPSQRNLLADNCAIVDDVERFKKIFPNIKRPQLLGTNDKGETPAHTAAENTSLKMLKYLCDQGCADNTNKTTNVNARMTPITHAAARGNKAAVALLLKSDKIKYPTDDKNNPLIMAANSGHLDIIEALVHSEKAMKPAMLTQYVNTLITQHNPTAHHTQALKVLLESPVVDVIPDLQSSSGVTIFHRLTGSNNNEKSKMLKVLLGSAKVPDPNKEFYNSEEGESFSPIKYAVIHKNINIARELLASERVKVYPSQYQELYDIAFKADDKGMVRLLNEYRDRMQERTAPPTIGDALKYVSESASRASAYIGEQLQGNSFLVQTIGRLFKR